MLDNSTIGLILPAMNEESNLASFLNRIPDFVDEVIVIDGNSHDRTYLVAKTNESVKVAVKQRAKGKGAALSLGFSLAKSDIILIMDVDGSMSENEIESFVKSIQEGYDLVKGSRYLPSSDSGSYDLTLIRSVGNRVLTKIANRVFRTKWTDLAYGFAAFRIEAIHHLGLTTYDCLGGFFSHKAYGQGFEIETLMFTRAVKSGLKVKEIPSFENKRILGSSNLRAIRDGVRVLIALVVEGIRRPSKL
jgi:glycosyltransferase involved in cell wall biosynthesis